MEEAADLLETLEKSLRRTCLGIPFVNSTRKAPVVFGWDGWRVYCVGGAELDVAAAGVIEAAATAFLADASEILKRRMEAFESRAAPTSPPAAGD